MEIGLKDILAWCKHPQNPRECLEEVYNVLKVILGKEDVIDSDEDIPATVASAREQMYQSSAVAAATSTKASDLSSSLRAAMEAPSPVPDEKLNIPEKTVELMYLCSDKYDDGLFAVKDPHYLALLKEVHTRCTLSKPAIYFPFGFGKDKDLLKVKKAKFGPDPKKMTLTLKFTRWEKDGRVGYSCYASKK